MVIHHGENAKQDDIALKIDTALYTIEKTNPALKGALPDNYYSRLAIDTNKLASLLDEIDKINTDDGKRYHWASLRILPWEVCSCRRQRQGRILHAQMYRKSHC